jgi:hypothetical protein
MLISGNIPNLVGGVSQQPDALRLVNAGAKVDNAWLSVVNGLGKRPPTEHLAKVALDAGSRNTVGYIIDRDDSYRYIVIITNNTLRVFDLNGTEQTVNFPNGRQYLSSAVDPIDSFRFVTVGDTTFVLNRERTVEGYDFGEDGTFTITPTATYATFADIPAAAVGDVGKIYYVTDENKYYRVEQTGGDPVITGWVAQTEWQTSVPAGYTLVGRDLPSTVTVGRKVYITRSVTVNGQKRTEYRGYVGAVTQEFSSATYGPVERRPFDLTSITNDRLDPRTRATVHVTQAVPNSVYAVYINNSIRASFTTSKNVDADSALQPTTTIADELENDLDGNGYASDLRGSTVAIRGGLDDDDEVVAWTTNGDKAIKAYRDEVQSFQDLPPNEAAGRVVKIAGDLRENGDDYYVIWEAKSNVWKETYSYGGGGRLIASSMPHVLVREADGTWTFKEHTWKERLAGSPESNPLPSFTRRQIRDIFVWNNRLGFLADENVILSETGEYENFFRTTLVNPADSDPLDFAVLHNQVNILQHAVPFSKDLLLFSDQNQFRFTFQNFLGPKNIQVQYTTSFSSSRRIHPINIGASVYFADDQSDYSWAKMYEYYLRGDGQADDAEEVTAPVPEYISSGARWMTGTSAQKVIAVGTDGDPTAIYFYRFFWAGERKIQTAWSRWEVADCQRVLWGGITNGFLYLLVQRYGDVYLERVDLEEDVFRAASPEFVPLIDRLTTIDPASYLVSYDAGTNKTLIIAPWGTLGSPEIISNEPLNDPDGEPVQYRSTRTPELTKHPFLDNAFYVQGDYTDHTDMRIGMAYTLTYEFSKVYLRKSDGQAEIASLDSRFQMRRMNIEYHNTVAFATRLTLPGRDPWVNEFFSNIAGTPLSEFGTLSFAAGTFRVPMGGENTVVKLELLNDTPYPCYFGSAEWAAMYQPKARRA